MDQLKRNLRVMKFGGTSVGDAKCIQRAARIIFDVANRGPVVTVVSALAGVTNNLIASAKRAVVGDDAAWLEATAALREQHEVAIRELIANDALAGALIAETNLLIDQLTDLYRGTSLLRELTPRVLDRISSMGERLSARLVAAAVNELGIATQAVEATDLIVTDSQHGQAEPLMEKTRERVNAYLRPLLDSGVSPVVTGFIGASEVGNLTTLGRGGSDYSATILGAALSATEVIIWTDVDGVLSADPRLVKDARILNEISYNEAAELAYFGAKVLHPKTLRPVTDAGIRLWIRNSFAPEKTGTKITRDGNPLACGAKAITAITEVTLITLGGRGIVGASDVLARVFAATASARANVLLISQASSQNDICFVVQTADSEATMAALRHAFALDLMQQRVEHITAFDEVAIVAVVGERMRGTIGIAGRTFSALGEAGVNLIAIAQGSSEYNISFVISADATWQAVNALHEEYRLNEPATDRLAERETIRVES